MAIPRFEMAVDKDLPTKLQEKGMKRAFNTAADVGDIGPALYISKVIHIAYIGVDEKFTETTAATFVNMPTWPQPYPLDQDFITDHPFLFLIRDNRIGSILFLGRLVNP